MLLAQGRGTAEKFTDQARARFGERSRRLLELYPARSDAEAFDSAAALAGDLFTGYATWKWLELHLRSGKAPVYRYAFDRHRPVAPDARIAGIPLTAEDTRARHAAEIEYVFGTLRSDPAPWESVDHELSEQMMSYWTNFARTGDPNGPGLPPWPRYDERAGFPVMHLAPVAHAAHDPLRSRYLFLDGQTSWPAPRPGTAE
jgi:para-nitrobenzyl esterase